MLTDILFERPPLTWRLFALGGERPVGALDHNLLVVTAGDTSVLIDPGGAESFPDFFAAVSSVLDLTQVRHIVLSHHDPDVCSSLALWREVCANDLEVHVPWLWAGALRHFDPGADIVPVPEEGGEISFGEGGLLRLLPAPYLPSAGNVSLFDPTTGLLYSAKIGAAPIPPEVRPLGPLRNLDAHLDRLEQPQARLMGSVEARDGWINMVRRLSPSMIVPQRGPVFRENQVSPFLDWFADLPLSLGVAAYGDLGRAEMGDAPLTEDETQQLLSGAPIPTDGGSKAIMPLEPRDADDTEPGESIFDLDGVPLIPDEDATPALDEPSDEPMSVDDEARDPAFASRGDGLEKLAEWRAAEKQFRLITRSDFDGLVCAVLLEELELIDDILFVHPRAMQYGEVDVIASDLTTNLPYDPRCALAFDHHVSEKERVGGAKPNHIIIPEAPSAARVVYDYFGGPATFPGISEEMMTAVDQADSGQFELDDVLLPDGWALLNFIMDPRTGLGRFHGFRIPNYELMMGLIEDCRAYPIDKILELPDIKERVDLYHEHRPLFEDQLRQCMTLHGKLGVIDLRQQPTIYCGNRFLAYALYPEINCTMHMLWAKNREDVVFAVGKSIFDRSSEVNVGALMLEFGGGGHKAAGTCQVALDDAEEAKEILIKRLSGIDPALAI